MIGFDLMRTKISVIKTFGEQLPVKNVDKFKMAAQTGNDSKVEKIASCNLYRPS